MSRCSVVGRYLARMFAVWAIWATRLSAEMPDAGIEFFEKSIRPILVKHCYECHSAEAAAKGKLQAGLSLDSKQSILAGGESGPALVVGQPAKSLIVRALKFESYEMPPTGRLPAKVIADFEKWIAMGAPDPRIASTIPTPRRTKFQITAEDRRHWAFQPLSQASPAQVEQVTWVRDELDRYVLAELERSQLQPNAEADKPALLRRITYALTGLPPTPDEITAFLADDRDGAFDRVVERLLVSPEYGVHWARHWLDGVRYADSVDKSGEYRRWVVRALNADLAYDKFVQLQIAGDLYPAEADVPADRVHVTGASFDGITATGMMSLAVWEQVGRDLAVAEIVDSQIDLVGRQLLGLTLACARCHDHKFDPISTQDYYSLAGVLFSSHIATGKLIADDRLGNDLTEVQLLNAEQAVHNQAIDAQVAAVDDQIAALVKQIPQASRLADLVAEQADLNGQLAKATSSASKKSLTDKIAKLHAEHDMLTADQAKQGWDKQPAELERIATLRQQIVDLRKTKRFGPSVVSVVEGGVPGSNRAQIGDAPVYLRGEYQREGAVVPRQFPVILAGEQQTPLGKRTKQSGRRELAEWITSPDNPLTARVMVNRIWQHLIGQGLVRSPDNFGRLGEPPTHPALLDHLAQRFIKSGWSIKSLVRDIALSATFRQSSFTTPALAGRDPENRQLARMNRRRLTYEELRDSLLRVGGRLLEDQTPTTTNTTGMSHRTMFDALDRRKTDVTAAVFDGPDSKSIVAVRAESTTASQALFLMNNPLVADTAKRLANQLSSESVGNDQQRVELLWQLTLGRSPAADEAQVALGFIAEHSWERFIQALLGTNEFVYID